MNPTGSMKDRMALAMIGRAGNVIGAIRAGQRLGAGATVVTLLVDSGLKYLSTGLYRRETRT